MRLHYKKNKNVLIHTMSFIKFWKKEVMLPHPVYLQGASNYLYHVILILFEVHMLFAMYRDLCTIQYAKNIMQNITM